MKKRFLSALLLMILLCSACVVSASAASYGTVFGGWLRLRANPSYDAAVITSYPTGSVVTVLSKSKGWCRVLTGDYRIGYMDQRYLIIDGKYPTPVKPTPPAKKRTWTTVNRTAWITSANGKGVRMRNAPEVNSYNVLGLYPVGRTVKEIRISNDGWSYIRIDGKYGYMMSQFLTTYFAPGPGHGSGGSGSGSPGHGSGSGGSGSGSPGHSPGSGGSGSGSPGHGPGSGGSGSGGSGSGSGSSNPGKPFTSIKLNITRPYVGDKLQVSAVPSDASFSAIWYDAGTNILLGTKKTYEVQPSDLGSRITVRVTGADGTVAELSTDPVTSGPSSSSSSSSSSSGFSTSSGFSSGSGSFAESAGFEGFHLPETEPESSPETESSPGSGSSGGEYDDLPDFVRRTLEQEGVYAQPADTGSDSSDDPDI